MNFAPPKLRGPLTVVPQIQIPKGPTHGHAIRKTHVRYRGYWAAVIDHNAPHTRDVMEDVRVECLPPSAPGDNLTQSKWGVRRYKVAGIRRRLWVSGAWWEHAVYESPGDGELIYDDCLFEDCGAQGLQLRHNGNRGDAAWPLARLIKLRNVRVRECGQARGVGRAGFSVSVKDMGPQSDVVFEDVNVRTIEQSAVVVKNGKIFDSFGGVCVEHCRALTWRGGYVGMRNPDRQAVQIYDFGQKDGPTAGPKHVTIQGVHLDYGNNLAITRHHDTVDIRRMKGDGRVLVFERTSPTKWTMVESVPLANGYRRGG